MSIATRVFLLRLTYIALMTTMLPHEVWYLELAAFCGMAVIGIVALRLILKEDRRRTRDAAFDEAELIARRRRLQVAVSQAAHSRYPGEIATHEEWRS